MMVIELRDGLDRFRTTIAKTVHPGPLFGPSRKYPGALSLATYTALRSAGRTKVAQAAMIMVATIFRSSCHRARVTSRKAVGPKTRQSRAGAAEPPPTHSHPAIAPDGSWRAYGRAR